MMPFGRAFDLDPSAVVKWMSHVALFVPIGFLKLLAPRRMRRTQRSWTAVTFFGVCMATGVSALKLFVYSRYFDTTDILTGTLGVLLGWRVGRFFRAHWQQFAASSLEMPTSETAQRWRRAWCGLLLLAWLAAIGYLYWRPFDFTTDPAQFTADSEDLPLYGFRRMTWIPLADYYWGSKYHALDLFLLKAISFAPLGGLAAILVKDSYRAGTATAVVIVALLLASGIETGRYFLPSRAPSTADIFIASGGAWLGFCFARHVRASLWVDRLRRSPLKWDRGLHLLQS